MKSILRIALFFLLSLGLLPPQVMAVEAVDDVEIDPATARVKSLVSGYPVGEIAIAGRLYIDLHANFMAARTEDTGHVLNWYNLGYSGGDGNSGEQGGTFGNFGLDVPWQERTRHYPLWSPVGDIPAIRFSGQQFIKADFPAEEDITRDASFTIEVWARNEDPGDGEVILGWQSEDGSASSAPLPWPSSLEGSPEWRHIVVVAEGDKEALYVDGVEIQEYARRSRISEGHRLVLGGSTERQPSFSGHIAAVRVHRGAIAAADLARNASGGVMLGTKLVPNIDPSARPEQSYFYHIWSDADPDDYFMATSTHFRYRIPLSRLEEMGERQRREHDERIEGMFELSEICYHAYSEIHALRMPLVSRNAAYRGDGVRYLIQISPSAGGSWMGWHNKIGFGYPMQAPGHMNPHELVHGVQGQTGGSVQGNYWEVHANFPQTWVGIWQINPAFLEVRDQALFEASGRSYYHAQLMMRHLAQTPQYGPMFISKMWYSGEGNAYPWLTFNRFNPDPETSLGYEWARMVQRNITWDYVIHPSRVPGRSVSEDHLLAEILRNEELVMRHGRVLLHEIPYMPGWYRPAKHYAPQQTGWNLVPLTAAGGRVTVELEGYVNPERGGDWHYGFVAVDGEGEPRYSDIRSTSGPLSFETRPGDRELFFVVAAIPTNIMAINMTGDVRSLEQEQFPYRVRFDGAAPRNVVLEYYDNKFGAVGGAPHSNGGGFVADTAKVADTAYVGPNARVVGNSTVSGHARIEDYAIVENATVQDNAILSDFALVQGRAIIKDHARVRDFGRVTNGSTLAGHARVLEHATLQSRKTNSGGVTLKGHALQQDGDASGTAMIDGHYTKGNTITGGRWLSWSWSKGKNAGETDEDIGGLYADYDFSVAHPWMARDDFGVTWGYLVGEPAFVPCDDAVQSPPQRVAQQGDNPPQADSANDINAEVEDVKYVLALNGRDQFIELPKDVAGLRTASYTAEVKWTGGDGERIFEFGGEQGDAVWLSPSENGRMVFAIRKGEEVQEVTAPVLARGVWTTVQVIIGEEGAMLFVDGEKVAENPGMTLRPESVRATACYLGRGMAGNYFNGQFRRFTVHAVALVDSQPPVPDPAAFNIAPIIVSPGHVFMAAVPGYDPLGGVEYYFEEEGGQWSSQWVQDPAIKLSGRPEGRAYRVKMRDAGGNEGQFSPFFKTTWVEGDVRVHAVASDAPTVIEAAHYSRNTPSPNGHEWQLVTDQKGYTGEGAMQVLPDRGDNADPAVLSAARLDYLLDFVEKGRYFVWFRAFGVNHQGDSFHIGVNMDIKEMVGFAVGSYNWVRREIRVEEPGVHSLSIWMREDGSIVDQIQITSDADYKPQ